MKKLLRLGCLLVLLLVCAGCALGVVTRAPGGVPKPSVPTLGLVKFTFPVHRQAGDREDQYALWLENPRTGTHFKTLAVTSYVATQGFKKDPGILPVWEQHAGIVFMIGPREKDVNVMLVPTPPSGTRTYLWYCDNDAGTEAMPAGTYRYYLEGNSRKKAHVLYAGSITIGTKPDRSQALAETVTGVQPQVVGTVQAAFIPCGSTGSI
ncbi:MAG: hypothetical protein LKF34_07000 [Acidaminococcaceae bacterium]|jgi:hypothetical protein|nr:hypothetical protein [Acidaminococcaceae bacterium]